MQSAHGGDLYAAQMEYEGKILDFSVNLNPMGPPASVLDAARDGISRSEQYPDPECRALRQALSRRDGVPADRIFCGNGASELIFRLALALKPEKALMTAPTFSEYEAALRQAGCRCVFYPLRAEQNFDLQADFPDWIRPGVELVLLCDPNNPTGRRIPREILRAVLEKCRETGAVLAIDQCFLELSDGAPQVPLPELPNLVLLRAFTKSYAIPGLRLGYCVCGNPALLGKLRQSGPCWNVSLPAQAAGIACCGLPDWPERGRALLRPCRERLRKELSDLGLRVIPGEANYLLFQAPGVMDLRKRLLRQGILIRDCGNYRGLGPDWYRVAVRREEDNLRLIAALEQGIGGTQCQR